jgi:intracellular multiplication protein IcmV
MLKQIFAGILNVNLKGWLGFNQIKKSSMQTKDMLVKTFTVQQSVEKKTFAEAMRDLNLTENDLEKKSITLQRLTNIYLIISCCIFLYSLALAYNGLFYQFIVGLSLTVLSLANCFKYSYFRFQIRHKKLGISLKEWFTEDFK